MSGPWEEIDAYKQTYYGVAIEEDYSFTPNALFLSREQAEAWVKWQISLWTEEEENGIHPGSQWQVLTIRELEGKFWNSFDPVEGA